jgi:CHAT domain-containing protein
MIIPRSGRTLPKSFGLIAIGFFCLTSIFPGLSAVAATPSSAGERPEAQSQILQTLELGRPVQPQIAGNEVNTFQFTLAENEFARITVEQRGLDLTVRLLGPDGLLLTDVNSAVGAQEPETLAIVAKAAGSYRIEIRTRRKDAARATYELRLDELRPATDRDNLVVSAERFSADGELILRNQRTGDLLQQAASKYEQSRTIYAQLNEPRQYVNVLNQLAEIYLALSENERATTLLELALETLGSTNDVGGRSRVVFNLGKAYSGLGDTEKAFAFYSEALSLSRTLGSKSLEAQALSNVGAIHGRMGQLQVALDHFNQVLTLYQNAKNTRAEVSALFNIGVMYSQLGDTQRALETYGRALSIMRELKYPFGESYALYNIATVHNSLNEPDKALGELNEALTLSRQIGDRSQETRVLNELGRTMTLMGQTQKALDFFKQALTVNVAVAHRENQAVVLREMALLYVSLGEPERAKESLNQVVTLSRAIKNPQLEASGLYELARLALRRNDLADARTNIETAIQLIEAIRSGVSAGELRTSYFARVRDYYLVYIQVLMQAHKQNPAAGLDAVALQISESARARSLLETLNEARVDIRQGVDPQLVKQERLLQQRLNLKETQRGQLLSNNNSSNERRLESLEKELQDLLAEYHRVQAQIRTTSPNYASLTQPKILTASEIQQLLDADTILLEYVLGDDESYLWAVTPTASKTFVLPKRERIEEVSRRAYDNLSARNLNVEKETKEARRARIAKADAAYLEAASELTSLILTPAESLLANKRLLVVSEGTLQYIPFASLPIPFAKPDTAYTPLATRHEIVSLPSISVLPIIRQKQVEAQSRLKTIAVIADPVFNATDLRVARNKGDGESTPSKIKVSEGELFRSASGVGLAMFSRLPFSRKEADEIAALVPEANRMIALDFAANKETVQSRALNQFQAVHFATHGLLNSERPELSGLVFSLLDENGNPRDGFLRLHEIYNLRLAADLVVLSACQTALGRDVKGEGLIGLTRGFMYAGASRVVAGLWRVDDRATAQLMRHFYKSMLSEQAKPSAALRKAQLTLLNDKRWASPYYWAPFVIQGEWR